MSLLALRSSPPLSNGGVEALPVWALARGGAVVVSPVLLLVCAGGGGGGGGGRRRQLVLRGDEFRRHIGPLLVHRAVHNYEVMLRSLSEAADRKTKCITVSNLSQTRCENPCSFLIPDLRATF